MLYRLLADFVLIVHFGIVLFVLLGMLLTLIGLAARWRWVHNFWFRTAHLITIVIVVLQAWLGVVCPLTILENGLSERAGRQGYAGGCVVHWLGRVLFYDAPSWLFTMLYTSFGALAVATVVFGPPHWPRRRAVAARVQSDLPEVTEAHKS